MLLFVTPAKVGNADRRHREVIQKDHGVELHLIEREEIITLMMMPKYASLRASFLHVDVGVEPQVADLIGRTRRTANAVTRTWAGKAKGHPVINLTVVRLDRNGADTADVLSLEQIDELLSQSHRIVLEAPAGRGKTTTLVQLAQRARISCMPLIVELPAWVSSRRIILEYIAGMPAFQAEGLASADLARVQQTEPLLLLLNGWNEITESNSAQADDVLRELERDFPSAGIIIANPHSPPEAAAARCSAAAAGVTSARAADGLPCRTPWREGRRAPCPHRCRPEIGGMPHPIPSSPINLPLPGAEQLHHVPRLFLDLRGSRICHRDGTSPRICERTTGRPLQLRLSTWHQRAERRDHRSR